MSEKQTATQQPASRMTFSLVILGIALFVVSLGFGIFTPILPQYATMLGIDTASLGLAYSLYNVTLAICLIPGGIIADRVGRVKTTAVGMAVFSASSLMLVFVKDVYLFALARMIEGVGSAIVTPAVFALVADLAPTKHRGKGMGFTSTMEMVGSLAGPTLGGVVAQITAMTTPFYLASAMSLLSGALVLLIKEHARTGAPTESSFLSIFSSLRRNVAQNRSLLVLCFRGFIIGITQGLFALVLVLYMAYRINMQPAEVGIAFTLMSASTLAFAFLAGHLSDRFGRKPFVILGGIIIAVGVVSYTFAHTMPEVYAISIIMGLGISLNNAPINALLADCIIPDIRAKVMGGYELIVGLGRTLGVMVLGGLYAVSVTAPFNLLGGLMFVTVGLVAFLVTEPLKSGIDNTKAPEAKTKTSPSSAIPAEPTAEAPRTDEPFARQDDTLSSPPRSWWKRLTGGRGVNQPIPEGKAFRNYRVYRVRRTYYVNCCHAVPCLRIPVDSTGLPCGIALVCAQGNMSCPWAGSGAQPWCHLNAPSIPTASFLIAPRSPLRPIIPTTWPPFMVVAFRRRDRLCRKVFYCAMRERYWVARA